jgi:cytochrome c
VNANEAKRLNPVGEWNRSRVVADGTRLTHYLNGEKVVEADVSSKQWRSQISASKYKGLYEYGSKPGRILIQDHHDPVWYRNMRIRTF